MKITFYKGNEILLEEELDSNPYYEGVFATLGIRYNVLHLGMEYFQNTRESFELRRNLKLTPYQKNDIYNRSSLELQRLLRYVGNYDLTLDKESFEEYRSLISGLDLGNLEDINELFDDNSDVLDEFDKVTIVR